MKWTNRRQSSNIEDRRGGGGVVGGGIGTLVLGLVIYFLGGDPSTVLDLEESPAGTKTQANQKSNGQNDKARQFVAVVLADTEDVWHKVFQQQGRQYREPKLVLFTDKVSSACGVAGSSTGPFYCSGDEKLYIDLAFFKELSDDYGAPGDFAQAYVIAHEVGHHVQNLYGTIDRVDSQQARMNEKQANQLSVKLELQADFYAGVWAHYARKKNLLDAGDLEEALTAATAIGDDRLQQQGQGYVVPDSFTHGTSAQRVYWFRRGMKSGDLRHGNTFAARTRSS